VRASASALLLCAGAAALVFRLVCACVCVCACVRVRRQSVRAELRHVFIEADVHASRRRRARVCRQRAARCRLEPRRVTGDGEESEAETQTRRRMVDSSDDDAEGESVSSRASLSSRSPSATPSPANPVLGASREPVQGGSPAHAAHASDSDGDDQALLPPHPPVLSRFDLEGLAEYIRAKDCRNIIVMAGAGISVSAGLPDFRTPGTGLYDNLAKYNLPEPTAVFNIHFFRENPAPFYMLAKELFPGQYKPTPTHNFIRLLHDQGRLLRCFTQNIDSLEAEAGIPADKVVACHGNFDTATCIDTGEQVPIDEVREAIMAGPEGWQAMNAKHGGLVKPDISFFGEKLPDRFYELAGLKEESTECDFDHCDLLIVMGTSLVVQPFASLIDKVPETCPRVLLNRQPVAKFNPVLALMTGEATGFRFLDQSNYRDVGCLGNTDDAVGQLASLLGCRTQLDALVEKCGGWPPPGPALEDVRPRRKAISKKTVAAAAKVFQSILGGGKRTGSPVLPAGLSRTGSPVGGRSSATSPASVSSRSCGSGSPAGGWKVGGKGRLGLRGEPGSASADSLSKHSSSSSSDEEDDFTWGGRRRRNQTEEEEEQEEIRDAALSSFRPLLRALEPYGQAPKILILQRDSSASSDEGGGGRAQRTWDDAEEEVDFLEAPARDLIHKVVCILAPIAEVGESARARLCGQGAREREAERERTRGRDAEWHRGI